MAVVAALSGDPLDLPSVRAPRSIASRKERYSLVISNRQIRLCLNPQELIDIFAGKRGIFMIQDSDMPKHSQVLRCWYDGLRDEINLVMRNDLTTHFYQTQRGHEPVQSDCLFRLKSLADCSPEEIRQLMKSDPDTARDLAKLATKIVGVLADPASV